MPNQPQNEIPVNIEDLRKIVHGLKMLPTAFIEDSARSEIEGMIKILPTSEAIGMFIDDENSMSKIKKTIGDIMRLIEIYGDRNPEFKARYRARTGLPPRYKVLDWEKAAMSNKELVRNLLIVSSVVDDDGQDDIAKKLMVCAKNVGSEDSDDQIRDLVKEMKDAGMDSEASLVHEAAFEGLKSIWQSRYVAKMAKALQDAISKFEQTMDMATLLDETEKLQNWGQKVSQMADPTAQKDAKRYVDFIKELQKSANKFNNDIWTQFQKFISESREGIATIFAGGNVEETSQTPAEEEAGTSPDVQQGATMDVLAPPFELNELSVDDIEELKRILSSENNSDLLKTASELQVDFSSPEVQKWIEDIRANPEWKEGILGYLDELKNTARDSQPATVPATAPAPVQNTAAQLAALDDIVLNQLIFDAIPEVWNSGYDNKAVDSMSPAEKIKIIQENVGEGSIPGFIENAQKPGRTLPPAPAPVQKQLASLTPKILDQIISKAVPEVWTDGYKGKAVGRMTPDEKIQVIKEFVDDSDLYSLIEVAKQPGRTASTEIFFKGATVEWEDGKGKIDGIKDGQYLIQTEDGSHILKPLGSVQESIFKSARKSIEGGFNLRNFAKK